MSTNEIFNQMLSAYDLATEQQRRNATFEVNQQIILAGLYNGGFFNEAAFYGGTCLRIFHGLQRFSEDMDFSLLAPNDNFDFSNVPEGALSYALVSVTISILVAIVLCVLTTIYIFKPRNNRLNPLMLNAKQDVDKGFVGTNISINNYIGHNAVAFSDLRPSGKIEIDGKIVDAISHGGAFVAKGTAVKVNKVNGNQVEVSALDN